MSGPLPASASVAHAAEGGKLFTPAADRNRDALCDLMRAHAPNTGRALEVASGTGQHIQAFAAIRPDMNWQPSDIVPERRASIDAYVAEAGLANVHPAIHLDATAPGWHAALGTFDLIVLINLLHLIPAPDCVTVLAEAQRALGPGGVLVVYGPFKRNGTLTSPGDAKFDEELRAANPAIGYKDTSEMHRWLDPSAHVELVEMPANNLAFLARKAAP